MKYLVVLTSFIFFSSCNYQDNTSEVKAAGSLKNIMIKGDLTPQLNSDSLTISDNFFGLGPAENMKGELMIIDGNIYKSIITNDDKVEVGQIKSFSAPFFVYGFFDNWEPVSPPKSNEITDKVIESYLNQISKNKDLETFSFKIQTKVKKAKIHVLNYQQKSNQNPSKTTIHNDNRYFDLIDKEVFILGFYSNKHHGIFTHKNSNIHMHLITKDKEMMGHLDEIVIDQNSEITFFHSKKEDHD
ncbi:acetolactate decarboxylase [Mangrovivirga cuniculi]|uniref:Alpha-acetolactate decarboxylase n=1 Tax=Mangrovivirga cuniculi TaxID=2715131 RepID=A0A4D7JWA5_9BACT|nr:acetolactate decarboxylase [Mangrovivirga cuniculi]QCK16792.1 alpha-acetolactate decarboxylase [Mangrovivirga cuniculi]